MGQTILVVAAHPDDDVLGCGGTMARLAAEGAAVHVAFLADGVTARGGEAAVIRAAVESRRAAARRACAVLGVEVVHFGDQPDNRLDGVDLLDLIRPVESLIERFRPATVFTHFAGDLNIDHRLTFEAVVTACRPQPGQCVQTVLSFEVPSSTEWQLPAVHPAFAPNWFVDIERSLARKLEALEAYSSELRSWPHARSRAAVEHLARWRGATVGVAAAEAFVLGRRIL